MFCTKCGAPIDEGSRFCTRCGAPVPGAAPVEAPAAEPVLRPLPDPPANDGEPPAGASGAQEYQRVTPQRAQQDSYASYQSVAAVTAADAPRQQAARSRRRNRAIAVAVILALVLIGVGVGGFLWYRAEQERTASESLHDVTLVLKATGFNTSTGSKLPVQIKGADDAGTVDEVQFVDDAGAGIKLARGTYDLTFPASPIAQDGGIYQVSDATIHLKIGQDAGVGEAVTANGDQAVELVPVTDWTQVSEDQLRAAGDYAKREGACAKGVDPDVLVHAATSKRDDAIAAKKAAEEKAAAEAAEKKKQEELKSRYHVETTYFTFDAPSYWYDRVTIQSDATSVRVYSKAYPNREILTIYVGTEGKVNSSPFQGTVSTSGGGSIPGNQAVNTFYTDYGLMISYYASINSKDPSTYYTRSEADELVDLQTGGQLTYDTYLKLGAGSYDTPKMMGNNDSPTIDKINALLAGSVKMK